MILPVLRVKLFDEKKPKIIAIQHVVYLMKHQVQIYKNQCYSNPNNKVVSPTKQEKSQSKLAIKHISLQPEAYLARSSGF